VSNSDVAKNWPWLNACPMAVAWLKVQAQLGLAPRTIDAYGRALADYIGVCDRPAPRAARGVAATSDSL
jgi:hypothetical protein